MKVAIVHDWITGLRGGERCLLEFLKLYPEAEIFTLLHVPGTTSPEIDSRVRQCSWLQSIPGIKKLYRLCLPLYPSAARSLVLSGYDLVISLSHAAAKNVTIPEGTRHLSYCFTPMRYVWDQQDAYFGLWGRGVEPLFQMLRRWDVRGSRSVDQFAAISHLVAARIRRFYQRRSTVIYPAVDTSWIAPAKEGSAGEAFLYAGALVPYKRPDLVVEAFNRTGEKLWIAGSGPMLAKLKRQAAPNITFLGFLPDAELAEVYRRARALIFPGKEDFGMIPVECMAAGRPVLGAYAGGLKETVAGIKIWNESAMIPSDPSGVWYRPSDHGELGELISAIQWFQANEGRFTVAGCRTQAERFSPERFRAAWGQFVGDGSLNYHGASTRTASGRANSERSG